MKFGLNFSFDEINFNKNKLIKLNLNLFSACMLTDFYFGKNEIADLHPDLFSGCKALKKVNFEENKLKELVTTPTG